MTTRGPMVLLMLIRYLDLRYIYLIFGKGQGNLIYFLLLIKFKVYQPISRSQAEIVSEEYIIVNLST